MTRTYEDVTKELDKNIPRDVISQREGGNGRSLSYLEGQYVIDRLNKVIGIGKWAYTSEVNLVHTGSVENRFKKMVHSVHYIAKVRLAVDLPGDVKTEFTDYGYGDGSDGVNVGKAHELAVKEAVTDGLKRCAKNLGQSMGLALYNKTGENIDEGTEREDGAGEAKESHYEAAKGGGLKPAVKAEAPTREKVNELISTTSKVVIAKKKATQADLVGHMSANFGQTDKTKLTDAQATTLLTYLKGLL